MITYVYHHPWYSGTENVANLMYNSGMSYRMEAGMCIYIYVYMCVHAFLQRHVD